MTNEIKLVGLECDRNELFKKIKLLIQLNQYEENINENGSIYATFELEAKEGDFKVNEESETLQFTDTYKPRQINIRLMKKNGLHEYENIIGTQQWHNIVSLFLEKLTSEDIYINLTLTRQTLATLNFDFETKFERSTESY